MKAATRPVLSLFITLVCIFLLVLTWFYEPDRSSSVLTPVYGVSPSRFIQVQGMQVHYRDEGNPHDSVPLVLLHGTGASLHTFEAWTRTLISKNRRVIRLDLPGFGLTGPFPDRNYDITRYSTFIHRFLYAIGLERYIIAGNSLGGHIAWDYTATYPQEVVKLILIDASGPPLKESEPPLAFTLARIPVMNTIVQNITPRFIVAKSLHDVYHDPTRVNDALITRYFELALRSGNRQAMVDRLNGRTQPWNPERIRSIMQPVLILWGESDRLIPPSAGSAFSELLPSDTLVVLPRCGHVPMEECPEASIREVIRFIEN